VSLKSTLKDKLEIGLKPDAPYRQENLPDEQKDDPSCQEGAKPDDAPSTERARDACDAGDGSRAKPPRKERPQATPDRSDERDPND
jgi:hypothetical protein